MSRLYFKALNANRQPRNGGSGQWPPVGQWTEPVVPVPCYRGYHLFRPREFWAWAPDGNGELYLAEAGGEVVTGTQKVCAELARLVKRLPWNDMILRLAACDFAERALRRWEKREKKDADPRSWLAVRTSRKFATGAATCAQLDAARSAAWDAAGGAAWDAAGGAAWDAAGGAAWDAAGGAASAARDAASAARDAAWDAENRWQIKHIMETYLGVRLEDS